MAEGGLMISDMGGLTRFDVSGERTNLGVRWTKWIRSFELYAEGKGVKDKAQTKALLLHCAGTDVQDIYYTLEIPEPGDDENVYMIVKRELDKQFKPEVNVAFERSLFRAMAQDPGESMNTYIARLRSRAVYCNFANVDEMLRDQIIEKCSSQRLRRKLLERKDVSLKDVQSIALGLETSEKQAVAIEGLALSDVNKVGPSLRIISHILIKELRL